ncbi:MAG TPA: lipocalin-like domain-containing protein [Anaerolineales bacterium]|nr:lipocalin-like domain-containing protein [Anaerolineales bacterium]
MIITKPRVPFVCVFSVMLLLLSCTPAATPSVQDQVPIVNAPSFFTPTTQPGFITADGSRPLTFPADLGAHPDFRTEWWYYTGNLQTPNGRHFGFELTIFRVGLLPPTAELSSDSKWSSRDVYFAHFAVSDIGNDHFYAFQRYSRPGPGLAGAQAEPYRVWLEDWNITERSSGVYQLQAEQGAITLNLTLTDEMGIVLHGENGYSRKGKNTSNASYYYSQPRLRANGSVQLNGVQYEVNGLAWNDHEFSIGVLDESQIGWDWFSLQFEEGPALMLFQLRERGGKVSDSASGTFIAADGTPQPLHKSDFDVAVLAEWRSPYTNGVYPSSWEIKIHKPECLLKVKPWMADQEINFPPITYWEGAVHFEGSCNNAPVGGNGYIELTGYAGNLPLP